MILKKDFNETFSETVRVGIITSMMPQSVQEFIYTSIGSTIDYDSIVQKIRAVVSNKVAMAEGPTPMDVGRAGDGGLDRFEAGADVRADDVDAVNMNVLCHACGGGGHYKNKFPTATGSQQQEYRG